MKPLSSRPGSIATPPSLSLERDVDGRTRVLAVRGELDIASQGKVAVAIDRALEERPDALLLDLSTLEFCDSSGVHLVLRTQQRCQRRRTEFKVVPPAGPARRVFELCKVEECVTFAES